MQKVKLLIILKRGGKIILNRDDKFFKYLEKKAKIKKIKIVSFGKVKMLIFIRFATINEIKKN